MRAKIVRNLLYGTCPVVQGVERACRLKKKVVFFSGNGIDELLLKIGE
ncbi:hypothetical protein D081_1917 [Anaerovibrio sp. JC8]|nr:hypothetical protein D081_1917 [Anaerovibrio sp. JC8]